MAESAWLSQKRRLPGSNRCLTPVGHEQVSDSVGRRIQELAEETLELAILAVELGERCHVLYDALSELPDTVYVCEVDESAGLAEEQIG